MQTRNLKEICTMDSAALTAVIDYWKDYDTKTVLLAYAELLRRNFPIPDRLTKRQNEFCLKYNQPDMDTFLNAALKEIGYNSYNEYYEKEYGAQHQKETESTKKAESAKDVFTNPQTDTHSENKYPALRTIAGIYTVFAWLTGIAAVMVALYFISQGGQAGIFIAIPTLIIGALIVLSVLAASESIKVVIDIEANTRRTSHK